jgi:hypothetical protein
MIQASNLRLEFGNSVSHIIPALLPGVECSGEYRNSTVLPLVSLSSHPWPHGLPEPGGDYVPLTDSGIELLVSEEGPPPRRRAC